MIKNPRLALELDKDKLAEWNMTIEDAFSIFRERFSKFGLVEDSKDITEASTVFLTDGSEKGMAMIALANDVLLDELPWFKKSAVKMDLWKENFSTKKFEYSGDGISVAKEYNRWWSCMDKELTSARTIKGSEL